jgi:hypothetical protein
MDITISNFMIVGISFTIFIRAENMRQFRFDEQLGIGAKFGSGEESDLLLFLLKNRHRGHYHVNDYIYHPAKEESASKAFSYGKGFGAIYKKAVFTYGFYSLLIIFILRLMKGVINVVIHQERDKYIPSLKGRTVGFLKYPARKK